MSPTQPLDNQLQLRELSISRRGLQLVSGLNLTVRPGEILGISGPSGCGKTTLLRCLAGMTRSFRGEIKMPEGIVSMVFQEPRLLPWETALSNVWLPIRGKVSDSKSIASEWLERVGLADAKQLFPAQMSGGMRQRCAIARAMATSPRILLVDEPFAALDPTLSVALRGELSGIIREAQLVTIWVSHDPEELNAVADQQLFMDGPPGTWHVEQGQ